MKYRLLSLTLFFIAAIMLVLAVCGGGPDPAADALILISFSIFLRYLDTKKMVFSSFAKDSEVKGEPVRFKPEYYALLGIALGVIVLGLL